MTLNCAFIESAVSRCSAESPYVSTMQNRIVADSRPKSHRSASAVHQNAKPKTEFVVLVNGGVVDVCNCGEKQEVWQ